MAQNIHLKTRARFKIAEINHSALQVGLEVLSHNERQFLDREFFVRLGLG